MLRLTVSLLFDYLYWMRDRVLREAALLEPPRFLDTPKLTNRDLRATLAHELDVELCWRARLRGEPHAAWGPGAEPKPGEFPTVDALAERWRRDEAVMRRWLLGLTAADLNEPVTVNDLDGRSLELYLVHVIEHGVTEFATASAILSEMGHPITDLSVLAFLGEVAPVAPAPQAPARA